MLLFLANVMLRVGFRFHTFTAALAMRLAFFSKNKMGALQLANEFLAPYGKQLTLTPVQEGAGAAAGAGAEGVPAFLQVPPSGPGSN